MKQNYLIEGFDPTTDPAIPANIASAILQAVRGAYGVLEGGGASGISFFIVGNTAPDVINNPWMVNAIWWKTADKVFRYYNTVSGGWDVVPAAAASITSLADGTVTLANLADPVSPGKVIRAITPRPVNPPFFEMVDAKDAITDGTLTIAKLVTPGTADPSVIYWDGTTKQWKKFDNALILAALTDNGFPLTKITASTDPAPGRVLLSFTSAGVPTIYWATADNLATLLQTASANSLLVKKLDASGATNGQYLRYNSTTQVWEPATITFPAVPTVTTFDDASALSVRSTSAWAIATGLVVPFKSIQVLIVANAIDAGYAIGDEVPVTSLIRLNGGNFVSAVTWSITPATATVTVSCTDLTGGGTGILLPTKGGSAGGGSAVTPSKWNLRVRVTT